MTVEFSGSATVPVGQYANIQPAFTVSGETFEEARDKWLTEISRIFSAAGKNLDLNLGGAGVSAPEKGKLLHCWASDTPVYFNESTHTYTSPDGSTGWLSGSAYAKQFAPEFPAEAISARMAAKVGPEMGITANLIRDMWAKKGEVSSSFGTSVHAAIELRGKYLHVSEAIKESDESVTVANPYISGAVRAFFDGKHDERAEYEAFVADPAAKECGLIDRLKIVNSAEKIVRVQDYKTNADIHKKVKIKPPYAGAVPDSVLGQYWLQLTFYGRILQRHGYTVEGLDVFHWNGEAWDHYESELIQPKRSTK